MSLEELQSDYAAVQAKIDGLNAALTTSPELVSLLRNDIVPLMGAMAKELAEVDEAMSDIYSESEDILQPETAGLFATIIVTGRPLAKALAKLQASDPKVVAACAAWLELAKSAEVTLEEITVPDGDDEDEDEDDEGDGDEAEEPEAKTPRLVAAKKEGE